MKKAKLNLIIDVLLLLGLAVITGIGFLMKNVLVPGYLRREIYGRNVELFFWGLDRHQWGAIHFIIGIVFLILIVLHIVLHWQMMVRIYCELVPNRPARWIAALIILAVTILLLIFPYFVRPKVSDESGGGYHGRAPASQRSIGTARQQS